MKAFFLHLGYSLFYNVNKLLINPSKQSHQNILYNFLPTLIL